MIKRAQPVKNARLMMTNDAPAAPTLTTLETAKRLSMAVRSVQLMVDRGELVAWKTPGGHRRIELASLERWEAERRHVPAGGRSPGKAEPVQRQRQGTTPEPRRHPRVLLIEDSAHYQRLVSLVVRGALPNVELDVASDGIAGLILYGRLQPDVLIVDILLPGLDGPTLIMGLRSQPEFSARNLIVVTSLSEAERAPYAYALSGITVVHKPQLAAQLPALLRDALSPAGSSPVP